VWINLHEFIVLGNRSKRNSLILIFVSKSWCKILRVEKLQQIVVVVLNGVTNESYNQLKDTEQFQGWNQLFTSVREYRTSRNTFFEIKLIN
jgi:hypothetical protein